MIQYYEARLDATFGAVSDPTRRGILARLGHGPASITELATSFKMTLTGLKRHVSVLEAARLVTTQKRGRVRTCRLGPHRLEREAAWIAALQRTMDERYDRLEALLEDFKEKKR